jgi:hypothetical protein
VAFADVEDLAALLGDTFDASRTAQGELALELASTAIRSVSGQTIDFVEDDIIIVTAPWDEVLDLPQRPVIDVASVEVDGTADTDWELIGSAIHRTTGGWGGPDVLVEVAYTHGYEIVPAAVRSVCLQAAARFMINPEASAGTIRLIPEEVAMLPRIRAGSVPIG